MLGKLKLLSCSLFVALACSLPASAGWGTPFITAQTTNSSASDYYTNSGDLLDVNTGIIFENNTGVTQQVWAVVQILDGNNNVVAEDDVEHVTGFNTATISLEPTTAATVQSAQVGEDFTIKIYWGFGSSADIGSAVGSQELGNWYYGL